MRAEIRQRIIGLSLGLTCLLGPVSVLGMESADCLDCHTDKAVVGDDFVVEMRPFINSAHAAEGCSSCHESVTDEHPDNGITLSKASCMDCHDEIGREYAQSGHSENASCSDCHNPHKVRGATAVSGHDMNLKCAECHAADEVANSHSEWLPQAKLHIANLPCISCHTASENLVISLFIVNKKSNPEDGRLELASHAKVTGDVFYHLLEMAMGAEVNGNLVHRSEPQQRTEVDSLAETLQDHSVQAAK